MLLQGVPTYNYNIFISFVGKFKINKENANINFNQVGIS